MKSATLRLACLLVLPLVLASACRRGTPPADPAYVAEIQQWRQERQARLTSEDGWLTLVGLYWLSPGENRFGSGDDDTVILPGGDVPAVAGTFILREDGTVAVHAEPGSGVTFDGNPVGVRELKTDHDGAPDVLHLGSLRFYVIRRADRFAVRVKDVDSPARKTFAGIEYFPIDPSYRVTATFEPFPQPKPVEVQSAQGPAQPMLAPGLVHFILQGKKLSLEPLVEKVGDQDFFFVFRDTTSGSETYGAGRFLDVQAPAEGAHTLTLDFNEAYDPPCCFTPYATCPLPPPENELQVPVRAGEKTYGHH
jgi:uncharacterized protein (DUF1684 family)